MSTIVYEPAPPTPSPTAHVRVVPKDKQGRVLKSAVVNKRHVVEGENGVRIPTAASAGGALPLDLHITHFGRTVFEGTVEDFENDGNVLEYRYVVEDLETGYPEPTLGGVYGAWFGNAFYIWTQPTQARPSPSRYRYAVADSAENLFREEGRQVGVSGLVESLTEESDYPYCPFQSERFMEGQAFWYGVQDAAQEFGVGVIAKQHRGSRFSEPQREAEVQSIAGPSSVRGISQEIFLLEYEPTPEEAVLNGAPQTTATVIAESSHGFTHRMLVQYNGGENKQVVVQGAGGGATKQTEITRKEDATLQIQNVNAFFPGRIDEAYLYWETDADVVLVQAGDVYKTVNTNYVFIQNITQETTVSLRPVSVTGAFGPTVTKTVTPSPGVRKPIAMCEQQFSSWMLAPGETITFDLKDHFYTEESWADIDVHIQKGAITTNPQTDSTQPEPTTQAEVNAELNTVITGTTVEVQAPASFQGTTGVFIELRHEEKDPTYAGFAVTAGGSTSKTDAVNTCGGVYARAAEETFSIEEFVGDSGTLAYVDSPHRSAQPEKNRTVVTLNRNPEEDFGAVVCAYSGSWGHAIQVYNDLPAPYYQTPILPEDPVKKIQVNTTWEDYDGSQLDPHVYEGAQTRALTETDLLFHIRALRPPKPISYTPPVFFGNTWVNKSQYPPDATFHVENGQGYVEYAAGLQTPKADPTPVQLTQFSATPTAKEVIAEWTLKAQGQSLTGPVDVKLVNKSIGNDVGIKQGVGRAVFSGLRPATPYEVVLFDTHRQTVRTLYPIPDITATAWRNEKNYTYEYDLVTEAKVTFFDGTTKNRPKEPVQIKADKQIAEQEVGLVWDEGKDTEQRVTIRVPTDWKAPKEPLSGDVSISVGQTITTDQTGDPSFANIQRRGDKEIDFGTNVYPKGSIRFEPYGYLPLLLPGTLEDYVDIYLIKPNGEKVGPEIDLDMQTELQVKAVVKSEDGMSPQFGIRVLRRLSV